MKPMPSSRLLIKRTILTTSTAALLSLGGTAKAADWVGGTNSNDWNTGSNWSPNAVPNGVDVYINTGTSNVPVISADAGTVSGITLLGTSRLDQTAGSLSVQNTNWPFGWVVVGGDDNSNTIYNIANTAAAGGTFTGYGTGSGSLSTGGDLRVGAGAWWSHVTGVMNINTSGTVSVGGSLLVGAQNGDTGTVNIDAGTVTIAGDYANSGQIAFSSGASTVTGNLNISGGSVSFNNRLSIGVGMSGSTGGNVGTVTMTGGTLTTNAATGNSEPWHAGLNMASGYDGGVGGTATFNLNGGTLSTLYVFSEVGGTPSGTAGTSIFNFNGGTLKGQGNRDSGSQFMGNITRANVRNGGAVIDTNGYNLYIGQVLAHSNIGGDAATDGGLTKNGAGTLTLSNANTYTGGTTVSAGSIEVINNTALGSGAVSIAAGASVFLNADSLTIANDFTLNGTTSGGALVSGDRPGGNVTTLSGTITLAASSNIASWWNDKQVTLSGKITGPGNLTFDRATALGDPVGGKFLISGATNDYTGSTTVNGKSGGNAILQLGAANALPTGTTLTLNDANLILNGNNQTLGGLVASTTTSQVVNGNATAVTLTVNNAVANTFASVLGGSGTNENNFALTKGGAGTLTLSGANTYTGVTTISAGKLNVTSGTGSGAVAVSGGTSATFGGTGTITGAVTVTNGSRLAPGTVTTSSNFGSAGTLTLSNASGLTLTNANLDFDLSATAGGANDTIALGSNGLSFSTLNFSFSGTTLDTSAAYTLIGTTGSLSAGSLGSITTDFSAVTGGSYTAAYSFAPGAGLQVSFTAVPEPATYAIFVVALCSLLILRRRRANSQTK